MDLPDYRELCALARRYSARGEEAEDLLQDTLLAALQAGRSDLPWLVGTLQNQAAMAARGAVRQKQREANYASLDREASVALAPSTGESAHAIDSVLARLPRAARRVAILALHGLDADEIRWILGITATAFRQRLSSIRKSLGSLPAASRGEALALAYLRDPARALDLQFGLLRRHLQAALAARPGLGTHDLDGHLLVIRPSAHTSPSGGNEPVIRKRHHAP